MPYTQRLAALTDTSAIAPLWQDFIQHRTEADPSMMVKPDFDFEQYIRYQLQKPLSSCFLLEYSEFKSIVGFLFIYIYDETPPLQLLDMQENPFIPRRVGTVLGLYVQTEHRKLETINLLVDAALKKAEDLKVSDIDLLISAEQTGIHALLEKRGFSKAAIQYTKHYNIQASELPPLNLTSSPLKNLELPVAHKIPLRNLKTNEIIKNSQGEIVYLYALLDEAGQVLKSSQGLPIYPTPLRDPQTADWIFDTTGKLVVCPVLQDEKGQIIEVDGIPQFCPPLYERIGNRLTLKKNLNGQYCFAQVQRNEEGKILFDSSNKPIFKNILLAK